MVDKREEEPATKAIAKLEIRHKSFNFKNINHLPTLTIEKQKDSKVLILKAVPKPK